MFPLILVILKILYSRMRMLEGLPPVSDLCWTSEEGPEDSNESLGWKNLPFRGPHLDGFCS